MMFQELLEKAVKKLKYYQLLDWLPDKIYLKIMYYACMHEKLNLRNPRSFNEKLQWIKLYDRSQNTRRWLINMKRKVTWQIELENNTLFLH